MSCEIYNNVAEMQSKINELTVYASQFPIGKARSDALSNRLALVYCDSQFHIRTKGMWGVDVVICKCPRYSGQRAVEQVKSVTAEKQQGQTFESFIDEHGQVDAIKSWISGNQNALIMFGGVGLGKSHLSKAMQFYLVEQGMSVEWIASPYMAELFYDSLPFRDDAQTRSDAKRRLNRLKSADYLIIDDFGLENTTQTFIEQFQMVLDNMRGRLVITTNLSVDAMPGKDKDSINRSLYKYGDRIFSRIHNGAMIMRLKGVDYRRMKK